MECSLHNVQYFFPRVRVLQERSECKRRRMERPAEVLLTRKEKKESDMKLHQVVLLEDVISLGKQAMRRYKDFDT